MFKTGKYIDIAFLIISIFLMGLFINWQISNEVFMIKETIGMFIFSISVVFKILNFRKGQYLLFILLIILLFNVIKFSFQIVNGDVATTYYSGSFESLGFSPVVLFLLMLYVIVNRKFVIYFFEILFHGSKKEREERQDKNITFYYKKFENYSSDELNKILEMYNEYPLEAQIALNKIKSERGL